MDNPSFILEQQLPSIKGSLRSKHVVVYDTYRRTEQYDSRKITKSIHSPTDSGRPSPQEAVKWIRQYESQFANNTIRAVGIQIREDHSTIYISARSSDMGGDHLLDFVKELAKNLDQIGRKILLIADTPWMMEQLDGSEWSKYDLAQIKAPGDDGYDSTFDDSNAF